MANALICYVCLEECDDEEGVGIKTWEALGRPDRWDVWTGPERGWVRAEDLKAEEDNSDETEFGE